MSKLDRIKTTLDESKTSLFQRICRVNSGKSIEKSKNGKKHFAIFSTDFAILTLDSRLNARLIAVFWPARDKVYLSKSGFSLILHKRLARLIVSDYVSHELTE